MRVIKLLWPFVAIAGFLAVGLVWAFTSFGGHSSQNAYCVDSSGRVVAQQQCANPHPGIYLIITSRAYATGQTVLADETRIPADDPQARTNAGLPATGEVPQHVQAPADNVPVEHGPAPANPDIVPARPAAPEPVVEPVIAHPAE